MATVTPPPVRSRNLAEAHQRVRSPLERLRSYIRTYVGLEGAAAAGLYLSLWFWIGLVLDYGFFRVFGLDWVQRLPWSFRAAVLLVLVAGLVLTVALKVLTRLFREFRDSSLALVLERRFPDILGDRLITAVELSDPEKAAEYGYSAAMVRETIHEAAQRVEKLPIPEVFDWKRLRSRGIVVGVLVVAGYLLAGIGWCTVNAVQGYGVSVAGFGQFNEVAGIWFERNILLQNTIWPRKAHLELIDFPESGEIRIGRGDKSPTIRVRALKYVIAGAPGKKAVEAYRAWLDSKGETGERLDYLTQEFSKKPDEGWRAVSWFDLTPELLSEEVPGVALPADWDARDRRAGLTIDEIELKLAKPETHATLEPDVQQAMRNVLTQIDGRAADPAMSRKLRRLEVPDTVILYYRGNTTRSEATMQKLADNEYSGQFGDLKETVDFTVEGLDYSTPWHKVVVVEPPTLESLVRESEWPAYLFYRPNPDDQPEELSGVKQRMEEANVSLQGGEVSRIDVPVGTNITLRARASKDLKSVTIVPHKPEKGRAIQASPPEMLDSRTFRTTFKNVRQEQNFLFQFTDSDNVRGKRQVVIIPSEDAPPKVRDLGPDDIVRKVQGGFMVTVSARVPFKGKVVDDHGLTEVRYAYSISRMESTARFNRRLALPAAAIPLLAPSGQGPLPGLMYLAGAIKEAKKPADTKAPVRGERRPLPAFEVKLRERPEEFLPMATVRERLTQRQKEPYRSLLSNFEIKPDEWKENPELELLGCDLPLWKANLKETNPARSQPRYQMQVWVEAVDTDLDSEKNKDGTPQPHVKASEEKFTFLIVSENELLAEIAKEEEKLYIDFDGMFQRLLENQTKLIRTTQDLSSSRIKVEDLGNMSVRMDQIGEVLEKSQNTTREVAAAYARILREMKTNMVNRKFLDKVDKDLVTPLARVDGTFDQTRDAVVAFRKALDNAEAAPPERIKTSQEAGDAAKKQMRELILALERIRAGMQGLTDINKLVAILAEIEKKEREQYDAIGKIFEQVQEDLFKKVTGGDKKPEGKKPPEKDK